MITVNNLDQYFVDVSNEIEKVILNTINKGILVNTKK